MAATNKRGIFSLLDVRERQSAGVWSLKSAVWSDPSEFKVGPHPYGYFASGHNGTTHISSIERIDFDNDTNTTLRSNLTTSPALSQPGAVGDASSGYLASGYNPSSSPGDTTIVERILYSNDTATASIRGPITQRRYSAGAAGNRNFAYIAGGAKMPGPTAISTVDRIDYSNDTAQAPSKGPLGIPTRILAGVGNNSYGYFGGGYPNVSAIQRIDYSNDTVQSTQVSSFSPVKYHALGAAGNANSGWFAGGTPSGSTVVRLDYSNDTDTPTPKGNLNAPGNGRRYIQGTGTQNYGYFGGGYDGYISSIDRIDYNNDTVAATPKGNFAVVKAQYGAVSPLENAINGIASASSAQRPNVLPQGIDTGYVSTGSSPAFTGGATSKTERIDYSNDTATATAAGQATSGGLISTAGTGNANFGYTTGGFKFPSGRSYVTRLDYFNDLAAQSPRGYLAAARYDHAATGNADFGYIAAGRNPSGTRLTSVDRIDYSNDTPNATPVGPIDIARDKASATGNANFGYVAGGGYPLKSTIERIIYANDTATAVIRSNLLSNSNGRGAAGTKDYGYWGGGAGPGVLSRVDRLDYSNDTTNAVIKGPLSAARYSNFGNSSTTHGYFGSGTDPAYLTSIDRIDYANDTATASPKGNLIDARRYMASFSSRSNAIPPTLPGTASYPINFDATTTKNSIKISYPYGYIGGGYNSPPTVGVSSIERLDFSNDTAALSVRGNYIASRKQFAGGVGNESFGYTMGGYDGSGAVSNIERLDYSNDTSVGKTGSNMSVTIYAGAPLSGNGYGYMCGGTSPSTISHIERLDFSNDTANTTPAVMSEARTNVAGVGNRNYGYIVGGYLAPNRKSSIDRLEYSNDTPGSLDKAALPTTLSETSAIGNADYGYTMGGYDGSYISMIYRIDYANDTATAPHRSHILFGTGRMGVNGSNEYGYAYGSVLPTVRSTVQRIDYSNDTATTLDRSEMGTPRGETQGFSSRMMGLSQPVLANVPRSGAAGYGYFGGGLFTSPSDQPSSSLSSIDRIDFANDTSTTLSSALNYSPAPRWGMGSVASSTHGYWVAGLFGSGGTADEASDTTRLDFSNDTGTLVVRGNLAVRRGGLKGVGNSNSGYLIGGDHYPGYYNQKTIVDRIDYSNDSVFTTVGSLDATVGRTGGSAVGNENFGYYAGGYGLQESPFGPATRSWSDIFRIDYSNDTSNAPVRAQLDGERYNMAAAGNANFGYFSGGYLLAPSTYYSSIVKYDYANDTTNASSTANLTGGNRFSHMGTGGQNFGYFAGGGSYISSVEKFDYSNDTVDASPKGPLSGGNRGSGGACSAGANGLPN